MRLLLLAAIILLGCGENPNRPEKSDSLIGEWEGNYEWRGISLLSRLTFKRDSWEREDTVIHPGNSKFNTHDKYYSLRGWWERRWQTEVHIHVTSGEILKADGTWEDIDPHIMKIEPLIVRDALQIGSFYYERR